VGLQEDFIGVYENAFDKPYCEDVIRLMDSCFANGFGQNRKEFEGTLSVRKNDEALVSSWLTSDGMTADINNHFLNEFWGKYYKDYAEKYSNLYNFDKHSIYLQKFQKTPIGGGYHIWHCEDAGRHQTHRILAYILYLNDIEEGGETEFLYYAKRIKPKQGTLIIFPAGFTHTHRGNMPISNEKYILTGWVEF
jgi:hypothetical protein